MNRLSHSLTISGEIQTTSDLTIEGTIEGPVWAEGFGVVIAPSALVKGDVVARDIVVIGQAQGSLIASGRVEMRAESVVSGRVIAKTFALAEGASFNGAVQPQQLFAALQVARHRHAQTEGSSEASPADTVAAQATADGINALA
jgi:cytoskeletal protein CcmA (bactofilin family)